VIEDNPENDQNEAGFGSFFNEIFGRIQIARSIEVEGRIYLYM
jgi:hypothetical protein